MPRGRHGMREDHEDVHDSSQAKTGNSHGVQSCRHDGLFLLEYRTSLRRSDMSQFRRHAGIWGPIMAKTEADGSGIVYALERLARLMRAAEFGHGLNPAQWEALRFLARANRFSNSPGALTRYLGATKGTISQTVKALERKKLIEKSERPGEKRSVVLRLTSSGTELVAKDPWSGLAQSCEALGGKTRRRMDRGLSEVMAQEINSRIDPTFGTRA